MSEIRQMYQKVDFSSILAFSETSHQGTNGLRGRAIFTTYFYNERNEQSETPFRKSFFQKSDRCIQFWVHMDTPNPEDSKTARDEGYLIRTRVNTGLVLWFFT